MKNAFWIMVLLSGGAAAQDADRWQWRPTLPDGVAQAAEAAARARASEQLHFGNSNRAVESQRRGSGQQVVCTSVGGVMTCQRW